MELELSHVQLAHINVKDENNPFKLFNEWYEGAKENLHYFTASIMNLATVNKDGRVSNRTVLLQEHEDDGIIFNTDLRGRKAHDIAEHPQVSVTIVWNYELNGSYIQRQARFEGDAVMLDPSYAKRQYYSAGLNHQLRNLALHQGQPVEWEALNERVSKVKDEVISGKKKLEPNEFLCSYKVIPDRMEFYEVGSNEIADRLLFTKSHGEWKFGRIEA